MTLTLPPGEPAAGLWRTVPVHELIDDVRRVAGDPAGRPRVVAVDGRGVSGKTTLAARLHQHLPVSAVVHTDDLAWHEPLFGWGHLLADRILPCCGAVSRCRSSRRPGRSTGGTARSRCPTIRS